VSHTEYFGELSDIPEVCKEPQCELCLELVWFFWSDVL